MIEYDLRVAPAGTRCRCSSGNKASVIFDIIAINVLLYFESGCRYFGMTVGLVVTSRYYFSCAFLRVSDVGVKMRSSVIFFLVFPCEVLGESGLFGVVLMRDIGWRFHVKFFGVNCLFI